jgi:hypothetical protein
MWRTADSLLRLGRGAEAVELVDDCLKWAEGKIVKRRLINGLSDVRLRHFAQARDATSCQQTAEIWEKLKRSDPDSLYTAARCRAITAAVIHKDPKTPPAEAPRLAQEEADRAMDWLAQAVAAGYKNVAHMKQDEALDALRSRDDFQKLLAKMQP